ncbi:MAG: DUF4870 family protein [Cellvibrionaceae bacterium]
MENPDKSAKDVTTVVYALQVASLIFGITFFVAIIINYLKRADVQGTYLASHFRWQIRTFWFSLLWTIVGMATVFFIVGWFVLLLNAIWFIYRVVRGWLNLNDGKPMYA